MKRIAALLTIVLIFGIMTSGCARPGGKPAGASTDAGVDSGKINIYASFYPMYFLASEIAGDKATVTSMVPAGAEPHDWEPTPKFAAELNKADMLIYNGAGMESWMENILPIIDNDNIKIVDASKGIELLKAEEHGDGEGHEHGIYDPHIWVSPKRIAQQANTVYEAIKELNPQNADYYEANMKALVERLNKLDGDIRDSIKSFNSNVIVVSHEAFGYFANDYGLRQVAIRGVNPQDEPSPAEMAKLVQICKENNVRYVFFEKLTSPKLSETLAREVGGDTLILNDAAGLSEEDLKAGKDYISVMYENLENLKKALGD
ncbi:MAG TPA: metal ABC transporter substrate-binding protein [Negativicutes bacterium]|nr:metal ABC transporter substrate-binding protein [Negativicutes bacterium]